MSRFDAVLALGALMVSQILGANIRVAAISGFGQPINGCEVARFSSGINHAGENQDYRSHFHGLSAQGIPLGEYDLTLRCGEEEIRKSITLSRADQFELIPRFDRFVISDPVKPTLTVKLDLPPAPDEDVRWIRMVTIYSGVIYSASFEARQLRRS
jgi:hypothetical protein